MLETVVSLANFVRTTFSYMLYGSYKTGYLLVNAVAATFQYLQSFLNNFLTFVTVLYESLAIFLQDNVQFLQQAIGFAVTSFDAVYTSVAALVYKVLALLYGITDLTVSVFTALISGMSATALGLAQAIVFLKKLIILFGSGVWFLIMLVPLLLYYICVLFVTLINKCYQEAGDMLFSGVSIVITFVKNLVLFVLDVPIESIAGLVIAFSLAYIFCQFYILITTYVKQKLRLLRIWYQQQETDVRNMYRRTTRPRQENQNQRPRGRRPAQAVQPIAMSPSTTKAVVDNSIVNQEKCCVICQERNKCILLLPCRHLCLCTECTRELRFYNETCPICRTNIDSTMKIYI